MSIRTWFARHAQTLVGSLGRVAQQPVAAAMTMAVIAVALALPLLLNVVLQNMRLATADWNQGLDLSVYMDKKAATGRTATLANQFRARPDVANVRVVLAADALTEFRKASGFGTALDALSDNPLPDTLLVTPAPSASTPAGLEALKHALATAPDVQTVQVDTEWVQRLHAILDILRRVVALTAVLLGAGVILIVGNSIRLDILNRRTEIEVMKLVGATDGFARRPFLYSGIWYGLGGGLVALLVVMVSIALVTPPAERLAALYGSPFRVHGLGVGGGAIVLGSAVALGWFGSWLAATHHIKGIEPT